MKERAKYNWIKDADLAYSPPAILSGEDERLGRAFRILKDATKK